MFRKPTVTPGKEFIVIFVLSILNRDFNYMFEAIYVDLIFYFFSDNEHSSNTVTLNFNPEYLSLQKSKRCKYKIGFLDLKSFESDL